MPHRGNAGLRDARRPLRPLVVPGSAPRRSRRAVCTLGRVLSIRRFRVARKVAKVAGLLLVGTALVYLVGMNVFLRTHLFRDAIGSDPDSLLVDYTSAYSLWPGSIHVEGLSIRGKDSHVEWILRIDRCDFRAFLRELAYKKFHADHVRADGVSMRVRRRLDRVTPETMSALPEVPGFEDPPIADVGPPPPPLTDATYNLWSIELDDVVASHVREVWVDTVRYSGELGVVGTWVFRPLRGLGVGPASVDVRWLDVSYGILEPWAAGVVGRLEVTIHPFDLQAVAGASILDQLTIRGDLGGTVRATNLANRALEGDGVEISETDARFALHAELDHGVLRQGTHFHTEPFDVRVAAAGLIFEASLRTDFTVGDGDVGYAELRVAAAGVFEGRRRRGQATSLAATFTSRHLDLAKEPFSDAAYAVQWDGAETDSLSYWYSRVRATSSLDVVAGTATAAGRIEGAVLAETAEGHVTLGVHGLVVTGGAARVQGDVSAAIRVAASFEHRRVALSHSELSVRQLRATAKGVTIDVPSLEARTENLALGEEGATGDVVVEAPVVEVPSLSSVAALLSLPPDIAVEGGRGTARVHLDVNAADLTGAGTMALTARRLRLRIGAQRLEGDLTAAVSAKRREGTLDLSGTRVEIKSDGAKGTLDWWGSVRLRQAVLDVRPGPRFRTYFSAAAKDGSPLTALVVDNTALPQWLIDVVSTKRLEATGEILVTPSFVALRSVSAHAQGADVDFELGKIRGATKEWVMLLDIGAALVGVDVTDGRTQVLLFGARPWFHAKVASLEELERNRP